jgi:hypothetical protein
MYLTNINRMRASAFRNSFVAVAVQRESRRECLNFLK